MAKSQEEIENEVENEGENDDKTGSSEEELIKKKSNGNLMKKVDRGSDQIVDLLIPITFCMILVFLYVKLICIDQCEYQLTESKLLPMTESPNSTINEKVQASIINALIFVAFLVVATTIMVLCVIKNCIKIFLVWLFITNASILFFVFLTFFQMILFTYNIPFDYLTAIFLTFNYGFTGMISLFWKAPLKLQQGYLVINSAFISMLFIMFLPKWSTWTLLIAISIWDLIAVLWSKGPLRVLVEHVKKKEGKVSLPPGMIYQTMIWCILTSEKDDKERSEEHVAVETTLIIKLTEKGSKKSKEPHRVKLGLGDLIFYSILVSKSLIYGGWNTAAACYIAILVGLILTLTLLVIYKKALPALPISIVLGVIFYFISINMVNPFVKTLHFNMIYM